MRRLLGLLLLAVGCSHPDPETIKAAPAPTVVQKPVQVVVTALPARRPFPYKVGDHVMWWSRWDPYEGHWVGADGVIECIASAGAVKVARWKEDDYCKIHWVMEQARTEWITVDRIWSDTSCEKEKP